MRFGRATTVEEAPAPGPPPEVEQLLGLVEVLIAERDAASERAERAEELAASYAARLLSHRERFANLVDGGPTVRKLAELAGTELPRVADQARALMGENVELRARTDLAEQEASLLARVVVRDEFPEFDNPFEED